MQPADRDAVKRCAMFTEMGDEELDGLLALGEERAFADGTEFIRQDDAPDNLYILLEGKVQILANGALIVRLQAPVIVGEMALLEDTPRTATVRAEGQVRAWVIPIEAMRRRVAADAQMAYGLLFSSKGISARLRVNNQKVAESVQQLLESQRARLDMGRLVLVVVSCLCFYTLGLDLIRTFNASVPSYTYINVVLTLIFVAAIMVVIAQSHRELADFGIRREGTLSAVAGGALAALPPILVLTAAKAWMKPDGAPLIAFPTNLMQEPDTWVTTLLLYVGLIAPAQEFIVRAGLQSSMALFLEQRHKRLLAILMSNLIFSTTHLVYQLPVVAAVFVLGVYWGFLFQRQRHLAGVATCHALVGAWAFWILGAL